MSPDPPEREPPQAIPNYERERPRRWPLGLKLIIAGLLVGFGSFGTCIGMYRLPYRSTRLEDVLATISILGVPLGGLLLATGVVVLLVGWLRALRR